MALNFPGNSVNKLSIPAIAEPSPIAINPNKGIANPPINNPIALIESDTATAFNPPKTA